MSKTRVVNIKNDPYDVYIGRGMRNVHSSYRKSRWANPYKISRYATREERQESLNQYEALIRAMITKTPSVKKALLALDGKRLACWCKPKACHGDILVKLIDELKEAQRVEAHFGKPIIEFELEARDGEDKG